MQYEVVGAFSPGVIASGMCPRCKSASAEVLDTDKKERTSLLRIKPGKEFSVKIDFPAWKVNETPVLLKDNALYEVYQSGFREYYFASSLTAARQLAEILTAIDYAFIHKQTLRVVEE
jgi:hypothetical protein